MIYVEKKQFYFEIFCYLGSCYIVRLGFVKWIYQYLDSVAPVIWMNTNKELCQNDDWQVLLSATVSTTNPSLFWDLTQESNEEVASNPPGYCTPLYLVVNYVCW